jgi:peroxiredoxin Q/BCP
MAAPLIGKKAPAFKVQDDAGETVSLASLKGEWVVLFFYPKDMTSGCTVEACEFRDALPRFKKMKAKVFGVSPDSVKSHQKFREKEGLTYPLLSDPEHTMLEAYGVWVEKSMYGRKYMGVERTTVLIDPAGTIAQVFTKVTPAGHADEVTAWLHAHAG